MRRNSKYALFHLRNVDLSSRIRQKHRENNTIGTRTKGIVPLDDVEPTERTSATTNSASSASEYGKCLDDECPVSVMCSSPRLNVKSSSRGVTYGTVNTPLTPLSTSQTRKSCLFNDPLRVFRKGKRCKGFPEQNVMYSFISRNSSALSSGSAAVWKDSHEIFLISSIADAVVWP